MNARLRSGRSLLVLALFASSVTGASVAAAGQGPAHSAGSAPDLYTGVVDRATLARIGAGGFDVASIASRPDGLFDVHLVLAPSELESLAGDGVQVALWRSAEGRTLDQVEARAAQKGYDVWRPFGGSGGLREEMYALAAEHPDLVVMRVLGTSVQGQEVLAARVTAHADQVPDGSRPAVLYQSGQHAREWIAVEHVRRLLHHFVDGYGTDPEITSILEDRELWFLVVSNPDGYDLSFEDGFRMWRRNARDVDDDGEITWNDGVDLNRNGTGHWGLDDEGSSPRTGSETYRGPSAASEPETRAYEALVDRVTFAFIVNYHSVASLLLYPIAWQEHTYAADQPLYEAYAGTAAAPAIEGYEPQPMWDLYSTNGETCDYPYSRHGSLCFVPEMSDAGSGQGFVFPDDDDLVQSEFLRNLPFAMDVARSAADPAHPQTHLGTVPEPFHPSTFALSFGDPQVVQAVVARELGDVTAVWRVGGGPEQRAPAAHWSAGERYARDDDFYFHRVRAEVRGAEVGDDVTVWFEGGGLVSDPFTYTLATDSGAPVLVLAEEDYTGAWPQYDKTDGPTYLPRYLAALERLGVRADVFDFDARGRSAPSALGVLSHYGGVIWYTGDDVLTTQDADNWAVDRAVLDTILAVRDYVNEGGGVVYSGLGAMQIMSGYPYALSEQGACDARTGAGCGYLSDNFFQYYLGGFARIQDAGVSQETGQRFDISGADEPLEGLAWRFEPPTTVTTTHAAGFAPTSRYLPPDTHPQFESWIAATYDRSDLEPRTGERAMWAQYGQLAWQRLVREVDLTSAGSAELSFWVSQSTNPGMDWVFVEAHTVGQDDWTTLPEVTGRTTSELGDYCTYGIQQYMHPHLAHYFAEDASSGEPVCVPRGTTGEWHAASESGAGWQEWRVDLSRFEGSRIEIALSVLSGGTPVLGVFLDDVTVTVDGVGDATSFEDGTGAWTVASPPPGSYDLGVRWTSIDRGFVPAGAAIATDGSLLFGFELGHIASPDDRASLIGAALRHVGVVVGPVTVETMAYLPWATTGP